MRVLFLGPPGAGKGTQCKTLSANLKIPHLSSGDLLREAVNRGTEVGKLAKSFMDSGKLVPDNVLIDMFREKLHEPQCAKGFILDGFPRNLAQAQALDQMLDEIKMPLTVVLNLQVPDHLLVDRIAVRRTCPNKQCNNVYHINFKPSSAGKNCDGCGAELVQRSDDKPELVKERLQIYNEQTAPLIDYYDKKLLLRTIDGDGDQDGIFADILHTLTPPAAHSV